MCCVFCLDLGIIFRCILSHGGLKVLQANKESNNFPVCVYYHGVAFTEETEEVYSVELQKNKQNLFLDFMGERTLSSVQSLNIWCLT